MRDMIREFASSAYNENEGLNNELSKMKELMSQITSTEVQRTRALSEFLAGELANRFKTNQQHNPTSASMSKEEIDVLTKSIQNDSQLQDVYAKQFYNSDLHERVEHLLSPQMKSWYAEQRIKERELTKQRQQQQNTMAQQAGNMGMPNLGMGGGGMHPTNMNMGMYGGGNSNPYTQPTGMDDPNGILGIPKQLQASSIQQYHHQQQQQYQQQHQQQQQQSNFTVSGGGGGGGGGGGNGTLPPHTPTQSNGGVGGNTTNLHVGSGAGTTNDFLSEMKQKINSVHGYKKDFQSYNSRFPTSNNSPSLIGNPYGVANHGNTANNPNANLNTNMQNAQFNNSSLNQNVGETSNAVGGAWNTNNNNAQYTNSSLETRNGGGVKRKAEGDANTAYAKSTIKPFSTYGANVATFEPSLAYKPLNAIEVAAIKWLSEE